MEFGEKLSVARKAKGFSQEELAAKIEVSRQAVSKWEMDQALPQIDKVLQICSLFKISTDELLQDKMTIQSLEGGEKRKKRRVTSSSPEKAERE